jgi:hypothetical protein
MQQRVSPAIAITAFVMLIIAIFIYGRKTLAEPPSAVGFITVNGVTREMTQQEGINMGLAMQGKMRAPSGVNMSVRHPARNSPLPGQER